VKQWYAEREGHALINFGASVGHIPARMTVLHDSGNFLPRDKGMGPTNAQQRQQVIDLLRRVWKKARLGSAWASRTSRKRLARDLRHLPIRRAAEDYGLRPHAQSGPVEPGHRFRPGSARDAAGSGASLHIVHLASTALREMDVCLEMIAGARKRGLT